MRLLANTGADRERWLALWDRTGREPFAHPDFVALFAIEGARAGALEWTGDEAEVLLPVVLRPLPEGLADREYRQDLVSPYGYGGPYASGPYDGRALYADLLTWMEAQGILTAFLRCALQAMPPADLDHPGYRMLHLNDNVVVDLRRDAESQWAHYEHKVRKNVRKAQRAGLSLRLEQDFRHLDAFLDVYLGTMERRGASSWYRFPRDWFETIDCSLRGSFVVAEVYDPHGQMVSAELVLRSRQFLYSFLGGTRSDAFMHAPNDLLKHLVTGYGRNEGLSGYVLGGGYAPDDGIFRYKRAFDPSGVQAFHAVTLVADGASYDRVCAAHLGAAPQAVASAGSLSYFPRYRAPVTTPPPAEAGPASSPSEEPESRTGG